MFMTTPSGGIVSFVTVTSAIIHFDSTVITGVDWPSYISCKGKHIINQQKAVVVVDVVDILYISVAMVGNCSIISLPRR